MTTIDLRMKFFRSVQRKIQKAQGVGYQSGVQKEFKFAMNFLNLNSRSKFIDIGGHEGNYANEILIQFPENEIHIFEPAPESVAKLVKRFSLNKNVSVHNKALGNETGIAALYQDKPGSTQTSIFRRSEEAANLKFSKVIDVDLIRLDDWNKSASVFDFIKIDAEGSELEILKGGIKTISKAQVVQFEYGGSNIDSRTYFLDFWRYFNNLEFDLFRMSPSGVYRIDKYRDLDENFRLSNLLAVRAKK